MLSKGICVRSGCSPLKSQKPSQLVERKVCLISDAGNLWGREVDICPLPPSLTNRGESFYRQSWWGGLHAETVQPSLTGIRRVVLSGLTSVFLVVSGTVSLQSRAHLSHFPAVSSRNWGSSCPGSAWSSSTWGFSVYKTAHRMWLRIWSVFLEKELNVLDGA